MRSINRFFTIFFTLLSPSLRLFLYRNNPKSQKYLESAKDFRKSLQKLGSTFIKLGQLMSARPDIIGQELSTELRNLLDNEPSLPFSQIEHTIRQELGKDSKDIFKAFEEAPLATASIAQVHKAVLHNGKKVAVKIQRPNIQETIRHDLAVFSMFVPLVNHLLGDNGIKFDYLYKEFTDWITNELDFQVEGRRGDKFRENMKDVDGVTIPLVYWEYTTQKVLTMEFLEGRTLNDLLDDMKKEGVTSLYHLKTVEKYKPDILIRHTIAAIAKQALIDKYFHGDLHPANIIIQKHNTIAFVDFGIVGTLDNEEYTELLFTMLALVENDPEALLKAIMSLITQPLSQNELGNLKEDLSIELHKLHEDTTGKISINHFLLVIVAIAQKYKMTWSPGIILAMKTIAQIDFVAGQIGLKEPLVDLMKPEVEHCVTQSLSSTMSKEVLYKGMLDLVEAGKKLPQTLSDLEQLIQSGKLLQGEVVIANKNNASFTRHFLSFGTAALIAFPVVTSSVITTSPYRIALTIGIPLLLFGIIAKIFGKKEVK